MDLHLERRLRLHTEPEHKSLYSWAINEFDEQGQQIGHDRIPWGWTLRFTATDVVLGHGIEIKSDYQPGEAASTTREVAQRQVIRAQLRPGIARHDGDYHRIKTTFSMFGTNRTIKSFQLDIFPLAGPAGQESCRAWGMVSYTYETDFRNETTEDCVTFEMFVKPATFARYAAMVADGSVDEMILSVGLVSGFYSEWSPSISTHHVKVLTEDKDQRVDLPPGLQFEPLRLGPVGDATLSVNRILTIAKRTPDPQPVEPTTKAEPVPAIPETPAPEMALTDPRILKMLASMKRAAWFVVTLLVLIFLTTLFR